MNDAPPASRVVFRFVAGKWVLDTATDADGRLLDIDGTGKYVLIDVRDEYKLVDIGGGKIAPRTVGDAMAVMAKVGAKYICVALGAGVQAAQFFLDTIRGTLRIVPVDAPEVFLVQLGARVRSY